MDYHTCTTVMGRCGGDRELRKIEKKFESQWMVLFVVACGSCCGTCYHIFTWNWKGNGTYYLFEMSGYHVGYVAAYGTHGVLASLST